MFTHEKFEEKEADTPGLCPEQSQDSVWSGNLPRGHMRGPGTEFLDQIFLLPVSSVQDSKSKTVVLRIESLDSACTALGVHLSEHCESLR